MFKWLCCKNDDAINEKDWIINNDVPMYETYNTLIKNCKTDKDIRILELIFNDNISVLPMGTKNNFNIVDGQWQNGNYLPLTNLKFRNIGIFSNYRCNIGAIHKNIYYYIDLLMKNNRCKQCDEIMCDHLMNICIPNKVTINGWYTFQSQELINITNKLLCICSRNEEWTKFHYFVYGHNAIIDNGKFMSLYDIVMMNNSSKRNIIMTKYVIDDVYAILEKKLNS